MMLILMPNMTGHHKLHAQLLWQNQSTQYHAKRQTQRMLTNLHGSVLRMAVEVTNLLINRKPRKNQLHAFQSRYFDVTAAESIKSNLTASFNCTDYVTCQKRVCGEVAEVDKHSSCKLDNRNPRHPTVMLGENDAYKYGLRGESVMHNINMQHVRSVIHNGGNM